MAPYGPLRSEPPWSTPPGAIWRHPIAKPLMRGSSGPPITSGWNFATSIQRGHFALWAGDLAEAEHWYSDELTSTGKSYLSGLSEACLFAAYAETGDPRAAKAWKGRGWKLPVAGELNSLGVWTALERSVIGLARLGWAEEAGRCARSLRNCSSPARGPGPRCSLRFRRLPGSPAPVPRIGKPQRAITWPRSARPTLPLTATSNRSLASGSPRCFLTAGGPATSRKPNP